MINLKECRKFTANLHFISKCNMFCKYCFVPVSKQCSFQEWKVMLPKLQDKFSRINFVGGEPTESPFLIPLVEEAKELGFSTSIVTNGYNMIHDIIDTHRLLASLDCVGISIDSVNPDTCRKLGRFVNKNNKKEIITEEEYLSLCERIHAAGVRLKINTVISQLNKNEDMSHFYKMALPDRIKIFQCLKPNNPLKHDYTDLLIKQSDFLKYQSRFAKEQLPLVFENNDDMINSYYMIGSDGCFWDNQTGKKSKSLLEVSVDEALKSIIVDEFKYERRYA